MFRITTKIICLMLPIILIFTSCSARKTSNKNSVSETTKAALIKSTQITTQPSTVAADKELSNKITSLLPKNNGAWAVYFKNLSSNQYVSINDNKMVSASLIKLFIMAMVYDEINTESLKDTEHIEELIKKMITVSHNDSSNELVTIAGNNDFKAGMKKVNHFANKIGCHKTEQQKNMLDSRPVPIPEQNYTSVGDCGVLLEKIYCKKCITPQYDKKMLDYLLKQERTWKIPAGLPEGTKCANKTGEVSDVENDVAIIFTDKADYILCVMSNEVTDTASAQKTIREISKVVYQYVAE